MDTYNFLPNKMTANPDYHAKIFFEKFGERWYYGYQVQLVTRKYLSPLTKPHPKYSNPNSAAITKNLAFVFALDEITKKVHADFDELDDYAVYLALLDECQLRIKKTAEIMLVKQNDILRRDKAKYQLAYILPKHLLDLLGKEETASFQPKFDKRNKQTALF